MVKKVSELLSAGAERPSESVVCQSEVLQHAEVEEVVVVESSEVVVAEVKFVESVVQCVERSVDDGRHVVVRHVQTSDAQ